MTRSNMAGSSSNHGYVWADEETRMFLGCIHEKMIKNYHEPKCQLATWYVARVTTCFVSGLLPCYGTLPILPSPNKTVNPLQTDGSRRSSHFFFPFFLVTFQKIHFTLKWKPGYCLD